MFLFWVYLSVPLSLTTFLYLLHVYWWHWWHDAPQAGDEARKTEEEKGKKEEYIRLKEADAMVGPAYDQRMTSV